MSSLESATIDLKINRIIPILELKIGEFGMVSCRKGIWNRDGILYIRVYDKRTKKTSAFNTKLQDAPKNRLIAEKEKNKFLTQLRKEQNKTSEYSITFTTIQDAYDHFLKYKSHVNPKTLKSYQWFYNNFTQIFPPNEPCMMINKRTVENWLINMYKKKWSVNTKHDLWVQCRQFLYHLFEYQFTPFFIVNKNLRAKTETAEKIVFNKDDLFKMFGSLKSKNGNFQLTFYLLFYTGLRPTDLLSIETKNIDIKNRVIKFYSPKSKNRKEIPFHQDLIPFFDFGIGQIKILSYANEQNINHAFRRFFKQINLENRGYSPRTFRKTFVTLSKGFFGLDGEVVDHLIGHKQRKVSGEYYRKFEIEEVKKELDKIKISEIFKGML